MHISNAEVCEFNSIYQTEQRFNLRQGTNGTTTEEPLQQGDCELKDDCRPVYEYEKPFAGHAHIDSYGSG